MGNRPELRVEADFWVWLSQISVFKVVDGMLLIIFTAQLLLGVHPMLSGSTAMLCSTTSSNRIPRLFGTQLILVAADNFDARLVSVLVS